MAYDSHANGSFSTILTAPSPATSGTSLVVQSADGTRFPAVPFNATVWPAGTQPLFANGANAEIVRVTAISTDTFTITRTQEGTSARAIVVGDQIIAGITAKTVTDIEGNIPNGAWTSWTPTWTNFTKGNATIVAHYIQVGKQVSFYISVVWGNTTSISGNMVFTLPVTSVSYPGTASLQALGTAALLSSGVASFQGVTNWLSTTTGYIQVYKQGTTYLGSANFTSTVPFTWKTADEVFMQGTYEAA